MRHKGQVQKTCASSGRARQDLRWVVSNWKPWRSRSLVTVSCTLRILLETVSSQKVEGPIGEPSRMKPSNEVGMSRSSGWAIGELAEV